MTWGWLFSLSLLLINGDWSEVILFQPEVWWALIFLGVASTGFAYALYFFVDSSCLVSPGLSGREGRRWLD
jgi:drug/metabolite transporter (DMT)-like permease